VCGHQCGALQPHYLRALGGAEAACRQFCQFCQVRLDLGENPYGGIAYWSGGQVWVEIVVREAYQRRYDSSVLPVLRKTRGGGVSAESVQLVALAMAKAADSRTGRESRLTNRTLCIRTGRSLSTVKRARTALRLLGVATEVFRGRQRTYPERMASWRVGDTARGWASVWALHPATPVDRTRIIQAGQTQMAPHLRRGLFSPGSCSSEGVTTEGVVDNRAASRHSTTKKKRRPSLPDPRGAVLASRWLADHRTPAWARRRSPAGWAAALAEPARHGWSPWDLNEIIDDWARTSRLTPTPVEPVAFMRWLLNTHDLAFSPTLLETARREQELAERDARHIATAAQLAEGAAAREAGRNGLRSDGHRQVRAILAEAEAAAVERKAARICVEGDARDELVARARQPR
jgi:ribosomal protein L34E